MKVDELIPEYEDVKTMADDLDDEIRNSISDLYFIPDRINRRRHTLRKRESFLLDKIKIEKGIELLEAIDNMHSVNFESGEEKTITDHDRLSFFSRFMNFLNYGRTKFVFYSEIDGTSITDDYFKINDEYDIELISETVYENSRSIKRYTTPNEIFGRFLEREAIIKKSGRTLIRK